MNHLVATYVDFVQSLGLFVVIFFVSLFIKQNLFNMNQKIERVQIEVEE